MVGLFSWFRWSEDLPPGANLRQIPLQAARIRAMQLGKKPERKRDPTQARRPRPPRSMAAEAARRQPRPRWTMAGPPHTGQLTRQRSAAAPSSRPGGPASTAAQQTTTAAETATQPRTTCTEDGRHHDTRTAHSAHRRPPGGRRAANPTTGPRPARRAPGAAHAGPLDLQRIKA